MIDALISLLILVLVLGIVLWLVLWCIDLLPIEGPFKQIAKVLVIVICVLILLMRALPLLGVHFVAVAHAQEGPACTPRVELVKQLSGKYQESPIWVGLMSANAILEIFARKDGGSWTVVVSRSDGISCPMAAGKAGEFVPFEVPGSNL